tara:strand:+ start:1717 stop:3957 length:2241 start_codon:yes stop_codon:yes gene_type:complete
MATFEDMVMQDTAGTQGLPKPQPDASFKALLEQQEAAEILNPTEASLSTGEWSTKDSVMGAALFIEGMTLGWSDEAISGVAAYGESLVSGEDYKDVYRKYKTAYEKESSGFKERQPTAALAAEIAGSIVSPIAKIKTASTLTGLALRGAAEGGLYAAGAAGQDDNIIVEAGKGLALGGGLGGSLGVAGWLMKKKIQAPLTAVDGTFTPITLAAKSKEPSEALLQSFYRDIVGPSYGGKGVIRGQEEVAAPLINLKDIITRTKEDVADAGRQLKNAEADLNKTTSVAKKSMSEKVADETDLINGFYKKQLGSKGLIINKATARIQEAVETGEDAFRVQAFSNSLPVNIPKKDIAEILEATNPNTAMVKLEEAWKTKGFQSIKDRSFKMRPVDLANDINKAISNDTKLQLLAESKGEISKLVNNGLDMIATKINPKTGVISGKDFSDIRSAFGTAAASFSDAGGQGVLMQGAYRKILSVLDDKLKSQLSPKRKEAFQTDINAWTSQVVLREAVTGASTKTGRNGRFTPDEWLASIKKNSPQQIRRGQGPLRAEAETVAALNKRSNETITNAANRLQSWAENKRAAAIKTVTNRNNAELTRLDSQKDSLLRRLSVDKTAPDKLAQVAKDKIAAKAKLTEAEEAWTKMQKARTPENPSWYHSIAATGSLAAATGAASGLMAGAAAGGAALLAGLGLGKTLATPTAQKFIAGQQGFQKAAQDFAATPVGLQAVDRVATLPRIGVGMFTGDN